MRFINARFSNLSTPSHLAINHVAQILQRVTFVADIFKRQNI